MNTRRECRTTGIVLRSLDYGESDRIVTFATSDFGKLKGIAKGARRSKKRFVNTLEALSCSEVIFSRKGHDSLALIESCHIVDHYPAIRENLDKTLTASSMLELVDQFMHEGKGYDGIFETLQGFLNLLAEGTKIREGLHAFFAVRVLGIAGYAPVLDRCILCNVPLTGDNAYRFSPVKGGVMCRSCGKDHPEGLPVSLGTIRTLLLSRDLGLDKLGRLTVTSLTVLECEQLLHRFIVHLLGKELKTQHVIREIRNMGL
jgi:DNA repair protein RecO (recombination protein O)